MGSEGDRTLVEPVDPAWKPPSLRTRSRTSTALVSKAMNPSEIISASLIEPTATTRKSDAPLPSQGQILKESLTNTVHFFWGLLLFSVAARVVIFAVEFIVSNIESVKDFLAFLILALVALTGFFLLVLGLVGLWNRGAR